MTDRIRKGIPETWSLYFSVSLQRLILSQESAINGVRKKLGVETQTGELRLQYCTFIFFPETGRRPALNKAENLEL